MNRKGQWPIVDVFAAPSFATTGTEPARARHGSLTMPYSGGAIMVSVRPASLPLALLVCLALGVLVTPASGDTIFSPAGGFVVGINTLGNLFDPNANVPGPNQVGGPGVGFRRRADGF